MSACWASCLGNCSNKISREHVVTGGLFLSDEIFVVGLPWCADEPKKIGLASLTAKILCTKHNSALSAIDDAGIDAIKAFREAFRLLEVRSKLKPRIWRVKRFGVDGYQLERWFLKTLINVAYERECPIGSDSPQAGQPSRRLVEVAFGLNRFQPQAGLYFFGAVGDQIQSEDNVRVVTLLNDTNCLVGAMFHFRGFRFLLYLDKEGPGEHVGIAGMTEPVKPLHHPARLRFAVGKHLSHVVEIKW